MSLWQPVYSLPLARKAEIVELLLRLHQEKHLGAAKEKGHGSL